MSSADTFKVRSGGILECRFKQCQSYPHIWTDDPVGKYIISGIPEYLRTKSVVSLDIQRTFSTANAFVTEMDTPTDIGRLQKVVV